MIAYGDWLIRVGGVVGSIYGIDGMKISIHDQATPGKQAIRPKRNLFIRNDAGVSVYNEMIAHSQFSGNNQSRTFAKVSVSLKYDCPCTVPYVAFVSPVNNLNIAEPYSDNTKLLLENDYFPFYINKGNIPRTDDIGSQ